MKKGMFYDELLPSTQGHRFNALYSANADMNGENTAIFFGLSEQVRQHFLQILSVFLSEMTSTAGMTSVYSNRVVDATLRLSVLTKSLRLISTTQIRRDAFLRTLQLLMMERLISNDKSVTENTRVSYPINHIKHLLVSIFSTRLQRT